MTEAWASQEPDDSSVGALMEQLVAIMARLRTPGAGCPWDLQQTHASLRRYLIEECYEACEAIDQGQPKNLAEELGDVLLQVVFHAQIASESGDFSMVDVIGAISDKLVQRHPHVFGSAHAETPEQVLDQWEQQKLQREQHRQSILDGIPSAQPAMLRAGRMQSRAARVGFDWEHTSQVMAKVREELAELEEHVPTENQAEQKAELGDLLFAIVNLARFLDIDPEEALQATNAKFLDRFQHIERSLAGRGLTLETATLQEMDTLWEEAKTLAGAPAEK